MEREITVIIDHRLPVNPPSLIPPSATTLLKIYCEYNIITGFTFSGLFASEISICFVKIFVCLLLKSQLAMSKSLLRRSTTMMMSFFTPFDVNFAKFLFFTSLKKMMPPKASSHWNGFVGMEFIRVYFRCWQTLLCFCTSRFNYSTSLLPAIVNDFKSIEGYRAMGLQELIGALLACALFYLFLPVIEASNIFHWSTLITYLRVYMIIMKKHLKIN